MSEFFYQKKTQLTRKLLSSFVALTFFSSLILGPATKASAQYISNLPAPGQMVLLSPAFQPPVLKGMTLHPENPLQFDFIVDRGQDNLSGDALKNETQKLLKYFLAAMTIPDDDSWVNLSPYEGDRIIPDMLGSTDMGKQMLEQDYLLKQLSASLTNPQEEIGKKFWDTVYKKAYEKFGTTTIPINTFNKVWIVPDRALVLEEDGYVFIGESHLKVMLDEDYTSLKENLKSDKFGTKGVAQDKVEALSEVSSQVVRQIILPELEKEINQGKNFAAVRQIYHSVILATWYKQNLKNSLLGRIYVDKSKIAGVNINEKDLKQKVYEQYLAAFRKGVYNLIKEDYDLASKETLPRKYFSGGLNFLLARDSITTIKLAAGRDSLDLAQASAQRAGFKLNSIIAALRDSIGDSRFASASVIAAEGDEALKVAQLAASRRVQSSATQPTTVSSSTLTQIEKFIEMHRGGLNEALFLKPESGEPVNARRVNGMIDRLNALRTVRMLDQLQAAPANRLENLSTPEAKAEGIQALKGGKVFIEIIGGGAATRMQEGLEKMQVGGLSAADYRIWNIDIWKIIKKIQASRQNPSDEDDYKVWTKLHGIDVPDFAKGYTIGQRTLFATSKGIDLLPVLPVEREQIRQSLKIVIHVNNDIQDSVEADLRKFNFFGFNPNNVILVNGGYGDVFTVKDNKVVQIPAKMTWNHGFAVQELETIKGYTLNPLTGERVATNSSVFDELQQKGAKIGIARRINDGILLTPKGAIDLDIIASLISQNEANGANVIAEVMKNPSEQKGGLALTTKEKSPYSILLEGVNAKDKRVQQKLNQLMKEQNGRIPYNRFFFAYLLDPVRQAIADEGGLPITLKFKPELSIPGQSQKVNAIFPEVPAGDLFYLKGVKAITAQRSDDFFYDEGILPPDVNYVKGEGALIHDTKTPLDLIMASFVAKHFDETYDIKNYVDQLGLNRSVLEKVSNAVKALGTSPTKNISINPSLIASNTDLTIDQATRGLEYLGFEKQKDGTFLTKSASSAASSAVGQAAVLVVGTRVETAVLGKQLEKLGYKVFVAPVDGLNGTFAQLKEAGVNLDLIIVNDESVLAGLPNNSAVKFVGQSPDATVADRKTQTDRLLEQGINTYVKGSNVGELLNKVQESVPANEQKLAVNQSAVLRLGDLTTPGELSFTVKLDNGEEIVVIVEKKLIANGQPAFDITPLYGNEPVGNRSFRLAGNKFEKNDNQPEEFAGLITLGVAGKNIVLTALKSNATVSYAASSTIESVLQQGDFITFRVEDYDALSPTMTVVGLRGKTYSIRFNMRSNSIAGRRDISINTVWENGVEVFKPAVNGTPYANDDFRVETLAPIGADSDLVQVYANPKWDKTPQGPITVRWSGQLKNAENANVVSATVTDNNVGGIDFDPSLLNLQIKRNGRGVPLPLPQQDLEKINIDGLYPVIINMQPATIQNFPFLISADKNEKVPELSMR